MLINSVNYDVGKGLPCKIRKKIAIILCVIVTISLFAIIVLGFDAFLNQNNSEIEKLPKWDKRALNDLHNSFLADDEDKESEFWKGFNLSKQSILLISKESGYAYLVNPTKNVKSIFAKRVNESKHESRGHKKFRVYRLSRFYPGIYKIKIFGGNFNTIGESTKVLGNEVYYLKFDSASFTKQYSSKHFATFLYHESFHYYMQNHWKGGSRFSGNLSEMDENLLEQKLRLLDDARNLMDERALDRHKLTEIAQDILKVEKQREKENPKYVVKERMFETVEGTATYVGILASRAVEYDFGPMYFDNTKNADFSSVIPFYKSGKLEEGFLRDRLPYETGAELALILHSLAPEDNWQQYLNEQNLREERTLIDALEQTLR